MKNLIFLIVVFFPTIISLTDNARGDNPTENTNAMQLISPPTHTEDSNIKFTSVYTDLNKDCKDKFDESDDDHDMPVICKGPEGYRIDVEYSACCEHMQVQNKKAFLLFFPIQRIVTVTKRKLEWRLANGKPFAVIFRIDVYRGDITLSPEKTHEVLVIKGLNGFSNIDQKVDLKLHPNPNLEARRLADQAYMQRKSYLDLRAPKAQTDNPKR